MMSLQSCRLVALVTSKNKSHVVFLILRVGFQKRMIIGVWTPAAQCIQKKNLEAELHRAGGTRAQRACLVRTKPWIKSLARHNQAW